MTTPEEIKGLERRRDLLVDKINRLKEARIIATDESVRFKYDCDIAEAEGELADVRKQISEALDLGTPSGQSVLREKLLDLSLNEPMGRLHLVNCNRQDLRDQFAAGFDHRQDTLKAANHYYFLSSCPKQMPPSLGERMVYELLGELLDDGKEPVFCRFNKRQHDRIEIKNLPIGYSLEKSQESFRKFMAATFDWPEQTTLEQAAARNLFPNPHYRFSILPFGLKKNEWKDFFPAYFDWIAEQLAKRAPGGPTLMLFFIFYLDNLHLHYAPETKICSDEKSAAILQALDGLAERHPAAEHYYPLTPVQDTDLRDWFFDLGENNPARIDPVLKTLAHSLPAEEKAMYDKNKTLNMDRIEIVQEIVFETYNK
jgi:hypothetical protein